MKAELHEIWSISIWTKLAYQTRGSTGGWDTILQVRRSSSISDDNAEFSMDVIPSAASILEILWNLVSHNVVGH
jgi:hypothetical protein